MSETNTSPPLAAAPTTAPLVGAVSTTAPPAAAVPSAPPAAAVPTTPLVAPPGWQEAMQGKTNNAKRVAASKRIFLILTLTFFGMMTWLYIIYSLGHSKKSNGSGEVPIAVVPGQVPAMGGVPTATDFSNQFGMPRGAEPQSGGAPSAFQPAPAAYQSAPAAYQPAPAAYQPPPQMSGQPAPSEFGAPAGAGNPYGSAAFGAQPIPTVPQNRNGITITAPREFRHAVGVEGGSMPGMANVPSQRMRTFVAR